MNSLTSLLLYLALFRIIMKIFIQVEFLKRKAIRKNSLDRGAQETTFLDFLLVLTIAWNKVLIYLIPGESF